MSVDQPGLDEKAGGDGWARSGFVLVLHTISPLPEGRLIIPWKTPTCARARQRHDCKGIVSANRQLVQILVKHVSHLTALNAPNRSELTTASPGPSNRIHSLIARKGTTLWAGYASSSSISVQICNTAQLQTATWLLSRTWPYGNSFAVRQYRLYMLLHLFNFPVQDCRCETTSLV